MARTIDLHGFSVEEAMYEFVSFYNKCVKGGYRGRIEVIHGWGSSGSGGAILRKLRDYVAENSGRFESVTDGGDIGNPGVTILYPKQLVPAFPEPTSSQNAEPTSSKNIVQDAILRFCKEPKSERKILAKLRGHFTFPIVRAELRAMVNESRLEVTKTDSEVLYRAKWRISDA
jgi:hypothetical protein